MLLVSLFFPKKIEPFASSCSVALASLQDSITTLNNSGDLKTTKVSPPDAQSRPAHPGAMELWIYVSVLLMYSGYQLCYFLLCFWFTGVNTIDIMMNMTHGQMGGGRETVVCDDV